MLALRRGHAHICEGRARRGDHGPRATAAPAQVVNLHYILSKATVKARPSVLWCYKKELGFSSHKQKRIKQLKKMAHRAGTDLEKMQEDPFELFISATNIRYCYYSESHKVDILKIQLHDVFYSKCTSALTV